MPNPNRQKVENEKDERDLGAVWARQTEK